MSDAKKAMIIRLVGVVAGAGAAGVMQQFPGAHWAVRLAGWLMVVAFVATALTAEIYKIMQEDKEDTPTIDPLKPKGV